jgi:hypothetical protein
VEFNEGTLTATVLSTDSKTLLLEYGTSRMAPRPFFTPAYAAKHEEMFAIIAAEIDRGLR